MLNFDESRFLAIQSGAVTQAHQLDDIVGQFLAEDGQNVFFLGTGGAGILMQPAVQLLAARCSLPVFNPLSAELVLTGSPHLGAKSLVVIPSLSGSTRESVAVLEYCASKGARTCVLVGKPGTPLGLAADHVVVNFAEDDTSSESFYLQSLLLALSILGRRQEGENFASVVAGFQPLPEALLGIKRDFEPRARVFAETLAAHPYHIFSAAGSSWPQALYYGMCILEEMQWIRTRPVHASDFFHGTLELLEKGVSLVLFKGEDATRPLADRVENFAKDYTDRLTVLDAASFALPGVPAALRALLSPVILATALERVSAHLEVIRNHPMATRRYYKRVTY